MGRCVLWAGKYGTSVVYDHCGYICCKDWNCGNSLVLYTGFCLGLRLM